MDAKFTRVQPTTQELYEYWLKYDTPERAALFTERGKRPYTYRYLCRCGRRIWGSGLGVGSHNRACPVR